MNPLATDLDHVLNHTRDLWDELRGARLFITGGTGFFGCWLLESFIWANDQLNLNSRISVLTRSSETFLAKVPHLARHPAVTLVEGDVRNFHFPPGPFSHIIHAAAKPSSNLNAGNSLLMLDTIVAGTRHTLDFAAACGAKKFLLTNSGAVYGRQPSNISHIPEDYSGAPNALDPRSAYGEGKRMAEQLCAQYASVDGLQPKIARCFAFVGPYLPLDAHFAIGNFIRDGLNGGPINVQGDGTPLRSYLYGADLAIWLWTIMVNGQSLRAYNVGSEVSLSIAEVAKKVAEQFNPNVTVEIREVPNSKKPVERYVPSTRCAKNELGLNTWISLLDSIDRTIFFETRRKL